MSEVVKDYLWTFKFNNIDNQKLYNTCLRVGEYVDVVFPPVPDDNSYSCATTYYHGRYNMFSFPDSELLKLYSNISENFYSVMREDDYYIRCWVNLFKPGGHIDWHNHFSAELKAYHGFYCVNTEGENESYTEYKIPGQKNITKIISKNGLCVFGKSGGDKHRASPWKNDGYRATIAFDVAPLSTLRTDSFVGLSPGDLVPLKK